MGYEPGDVVSGFDLPNANGSGNLSLDKVLTDVGAIVVFECNHCPYVKAVISDIVNDCETCLLYTSPSPRDS